MSDRILILGLGSIGQRHARNALKLGCEVIGYDPALPPGGERADSLVRDLNLTVTDCLERGFAHDPLGVIVATPPEHHMLNLSQVMVAKVPVFIEKPLCYSETTAEAAVNNCEAQGIPLLIGYQLRHIAALKRLKVQADAGEFGEIYAAHAEFASQQWCSHTYKADLLLECSHELDLLRWFLGEPQSVTAWGFSGREMRAGMIAFSRGSQATFRLDGLAPGYLRRLTLYGTKGIGEWSLDQAENDQAYLDELAEFLCVCRGEQAAPSCTGRDGWWAVRMAEAIRRSGESGRWEQV